MMMMMMMMMMLLTGPDTKRRFPVRGVPGKRCLAKMVKGTYLCKVISNYT